MIVVGLSGCNSDQSESKKPAKASAEQSEQEVKLKNNIALSSTEATTREKVDFTVDQLEPNQSVQLKWIAVDGKYKIENLYAFIGPEYTEKEVVLAEGTSDSNGVWKGSFSVPEGFGGDHTIFVTSKETKIGQIGFFVTPIFTMSPESGPVGTEVTIRVEGLGYDTYKSLWQLTYDNKYTGMVSAISTNGTAEAKFRASGPVGKHPISIRSGYLGSPYINHTQSPHSYWPAPDFVFEVTNEKPLVENRVESSPIAAGGGVTMPEIKNKSGVEVTLDKKEGTVGELVNLTSTGLPADEKVEIIWNTMKGSRVTELGFAEESSTLANLTTDNEGQLSYDFQIPDDLGGIPHRIDIKVGDEVYGQEYLRILPSIVDISPKSGPVGTKFTVTIKGGGWTEYDNAYYMTYDNAHMGYMCSFNSQGTLVFEVYASGEPGYHLIDLYPGLYMQKEKKTDMTLVPQLTYSTDHPGSAMPAIRLAFEITK